MGMLTTDGFSSFTADPQSEDIGTDGKNSFKLSTLLPKLLSSRVEEWSPAHLAVVLGDRTSLPRVCRSWHEPSCGENLISSGPYVSKIRGGPVMVPLSLSSAINTILTSEG